MYNLQHLCIVSFLSFSLAATPPSLDRHASLQARGGLFSKNRDQPIGPNLPVVKDFSCTGVDKKYCEERCYCDKFGQVVCDKRYKEVKLLPGEEWTKRYGAMALQAVCGPACGCSVDGVRMTGGLTINELRRLDMLHQHAREGGRYTGRMSGDLDSMGLIAGPSNPGHAGAGPMPRVRVPGLPHSGSSESFGGQSSGVGEPGAGPSRSGARVPGTPRPGSLDNQNFGVGGHYRGPSNPTAYVPGTPRLGLPGSPGARDSGV